LTSSYENNFLMPCNFTPTSKNPKTTYAWIDIISNKKERKKSMTEEQDRLMNNVLSEKKIIWYNKKQGEKKKNCNQYPPETPAKITNLKKKCNRQTKKNRIYVLQSHLWHLLWTKKTGDTTQNYIKQHQCVLTFTTSYFMNSSTYLVAFDGKHR